VHHSRLPLLLHLQPVHHRLGRLKSLLGLMKI
jgi:hypothetical protein